MLPLRTFLSHPSIASFLSMVTAERGVVIEDELAYGPLPRHRADIYTSAATPDDGPILLFIYGGGWDSGERSYYGFVGSAFAAKGITTVIPDYRLFPEVKYPVFMHDVAQAYAWVHRKFCAPGKPPRPIFICGHSAGAHAAGLLCYDESFLTGIDPELPRPAGFVGLSGPYAYDPTTHVRSRHIFETAQSVDQVRPIAHVSLGAPPSLLMHGAKDQIVQFKNAKVLSAALRDLGIRAEAIEFANMAHTDMVIAIARPFRWRAPVFSNAVRFIEECAKSRSSTV